MTRQEFFEYCLYTYGTSLDYPFDEDFETAVLRHTDMRKRYAIVMKVSRRKFEMFGSFGVADGAYPAYHMNKLHWISVLLPDASDNVVQFLVKTSFEATKLKRKVSKNR